MLVIQNTFIHFDLIVNTFLQEISENKEVKKEYKVLPNSDLLALNYLYTIPGSGLILLSAARKIEGLLKEISIKRAINCLIGECRH